MTLGTFHKSIRRPIPTLNLTIVFVSLSNTYKRTISDVTQPNNTELTDKPSKDFLFRQNWMSIYLKNKINLTNFQKLVSNLCVPFLKAKNSNTLWTRVIMTVSAKRYGFVSNKVRFIVSWSSSEESSWSMLPYHWFFTDWDTYNCHFQSCKWLNVRVKFKLDTVLFTGW